MTVSEIARRAGVSADTVRHYVRVGLLQPRRDPGNGYRRFTNEDVQRINFVRNARLLGYSLHEIGRIFSLRDNGQSPCASVRRTLESRIEENRVRLDALIKMQVRMEEALAIWREMPDQSPESDSICHLIESFGDAAEQS